MTKWLGVLLSSAIIFTACDKDKSKSCTYYNKPLPTNVALVGFFDYEVNNMILNQYEKNSNFGILLRSDTIQIEPMPVFTRDTSASLLEFSSKSDYEIIFPNIDEKYRIDKISYLPEYFEVVEPSGICNQSESYEQTADSLRMDNQYYTLTKKSPTDVYFYLKRR